MCSTAQRRSPHFTPNNQQRSTCREPRSTNSVRLKSEKCLFATPVTALRKFEGSTTLGTVAIRFCLSTFTFKRRNQTRSPRSMNLEELQVEQLVIAVEPFISSTSRVDGKLKGQQSVPLETEKTGRSVREQTTVQS